jgi:hypothetical protein
MDSIRSQIYVTRDNRQDVRADRKFSCSELTYRISLFDVDSLNNREIFLLCSPYLVLGGQAKSQEIEAGTKPADTRRDDSELSKDVVLGAEF